MIPKHIDKCKKSMIQCVPDPDKYTWSNKFTNHVERIDLLLHHCNIWRVYSMNYLCVSSSSFATYLTTYLFIRCTLVLFQDDAILKNKSHLKLAHKMSKNNYFDIFRYIKRFCHRSIWHGVIKMASFQSIHNDANNINLVYL